MNKLKLKNNYMSTSPRSTILKIGLIATKKYKKRTIYTETLIYAYANECTFITKILQQRTI